uniref:AtC3H23-like CCCH zinc finger domain-containing protein n=1 Tax=Solanum lycopersicum TaxID=4081 RepID=A0A3Q7HDD9_SOLLC
MNLFEQRPNSAKRKIKAQKKQIYKYLNQKKLGKLSTPSFYSYILRCRLLEVFGEEASSSSSSRLLQFDEVHMIYSSGSRPLVNSERDFNDSFTPIVGTFYYTNSQYFSYYSSASLFHKEFVGQEANSQRFQKFISQDLYESDNFRMYIYKVQKCSKHYSHDWTSCPFTHEGEKARRRDPRKYNYLPIPCPGYKFVSCIKGDNCELCHGVFEYWLHPAKYRTTPCQTLNKLRPEMKYNWSFVYQYPINIQSYPDIIIENGPYGNSMIVPCNSQLQPPPHNHYYSTAFGLFAQPPPSSSPTHPKFVHNVQN